MPIMLTLEGVKKLKKELEELKARRPLIAKRIEQAKELGDLKENAEYHAAKDEQGMMEAKIREIASLLAQAEITEKTSGGGLIGFGSKIKIKVGDRQKEFKIVGAPEADLHQGKISYDSPLAQALLGHKKDEEVEVEAPAGKIIYKILEVE